MKKISFNLLLIITIILWSITVIVIDSFTQSNIKNTLITIHLENYANQNNLKNIEIYQNDTLDSFQNRLNKSFIYEKNTYNCKYWSLQWRNFAKNQGYKHTYIITETHIFGLIYLNNSYCIVDQKKVLC